MIVPCIYVFPLFITLQRVFNVLKCFFMGCIVHRSVSVRKDDKCVFVPLCVVLRDYYWLKRNTFLELDKVLCFSLLFMSLLYFCLLKGPQWMSVQYNKAERLNPKPSFQSGHKCHLSFMAPVQMCRANCAHGEWVSCSSDRW